MAAATLHPVQILRDHATAFEAELSACLAAPRPKAVHRLRTESRRLEAQIRLLESVQGVVPPFRSEAAKAKRYIKVLRQAAGRVRDLDVQTDRLKKCARRAGAQPKTTGDEALSLAADVGQMLAKRERRRKRAAKKLVALIGQDQAKVSRTLEQLLSALEPNEGMHITTPELLRIAHSFFDRAMARARSRPSTGQLHTVRKAAKQARYLAENAASHAAIADARRFEALQKAGGVWHDWLDLTAAAEDELGKKHVAVRQFAALRDRHLAAYQAQLFGV